MLHSLNHSLGRKVTPRSMKMAAYLKLSTSLVVAGLLLTACTIETNTEAETEEAKIVVDDFCFLRLCFSVGFDRTGR